jgi:hypothetical protein
MSEWLASPERAKTLGDDMVNTSKKFIALMGFLSILCAIPTVAQISNKVTFDAPFAFYAGNAKMPAGSYTITQPSVDDNLLLIEDTTGSHSVYVEYVVNSLDNPHPQSDVTFNKYGKADFLTLIWIQGQDSGMQILPSKAEQNAAKAAAAERHSLLAKNAG